MLALRQILIGSSDLDSSLLSPPGLCSVGSNDPWECHPERTTRSFLVPDRFGSGTRKSSPQDNNGATKAQQVDEGDRRHEERLRDLRSHTVQL